MTTSRIQNAVHASHLFEEAIRDQTRADNAWAIDRNVARKVHVIADLVEVDPVIVTTAIVEKGIRRCISTANDLRNTIWRHNTPKALLEQIPAPVPSGLNTIGGLFVRYLDSRYAQGMTWAAWVDENRDGLAVLYAHGRDAEWIESMGSGCCRATKGGAA